MESRRIFQRISTAAGNFHLRTFTRTDILTGEKGCQGVRKYQLVAHLVLLIVSSVGSVAPLAKSFHCTVAPGVTALRLAGHPYRLFKPRRCVLPRAAAAFIVLWSVAGRDELSILSVG